jgi:hypothetical protein
VTEKEILIEKLKKNPLSISDMPDDVKNDKELAMIAVDNDGFSLKFLSSRLKNDEEIVLAALGSFSTSFEFASERLKNDVSFIKKAIEISPVSIAYIPTDIRYDKSIALAAVKKLPIVCKELPIELRGDKDIMFEATRRMSEMTAKYSSMDIKNDKGFILRIISDSMTKKNMMYYLPKRLREDQDIKSAALANNMVDIDKNFILSLFQIDNMAYASIVDKNKDIIAISKKEYPVINTADGDEYNADEVYRATLSAIGSVMTKSKVSYDDILTIGVAGQYGAVMLWKNVNSYRSSPFTDKKGGLTDSVDKNLYEKMHNTPATNIISGKSNHSKAIIDNIGGEVFNAIEITTDTRLTNMSGGPKIAGIIDRYNLRMETERAFTLFNTLDMWISRKLCNNYTPIMNYASALSTSLFNKQTSKWDKSICSTFGIPVNILPEVRPISEIYYFTDIFSSHTPVSAMALDITAYRYGEKVLDPDYDMSFMNRAAIEFSENEECLITVEQPWPGFGESEDDIRKIALGTAYLAGLTLEFWE